MILALVAAVQVFTLSPADKAAAIAAGENAKLSQYAREDERRAADRAPGGLFGLGVGTGIVPQGYAPLGDVGQNGFVFTPGSIGARRFRD